MEKRELKTIQMFDKLNRISAVGERNKGNGNTVYSVEKPDGTEIAKIQFQNGPRGKEDSTDGLIDEDLLEIVRDRLRGFQEGPFSCRENALALTAVEEALLWLDHRKNDRKDRNVLNKYEK